MFGMGVPEILLILAIALIVIGPKKLPDLARGLGRALGEFKRATSELKASMDIDPGMKDVKSAFDDLNTEIRQAVVSAPKSTSAGKGQAKAEDPTGGSTEKRPPTAEAMTDLKAAFDRLDRDPDTAKGTVVSQADAIDGSAPPAGDAPPKSG